jgi:hypothetical protein
MKPQLKTILKHLNKVGSITNREAIVEYNIMSLPRRINDLEQDWGIQFKREMKAHPVTGQRYVRYHLLTKHIVKGYCLVIDNNGELKAEWKETV